MEVFSGLGSVGVVPDGLEAATGEAAGWLAADGEAAGLGASVGLAAGAAVGAGADVGAAAGVVGPHADASSAKAATAASAG